MKTKRFLSVLLALALCLGMLPGTTLATEEVTENNAAEGDTTSSDTLLLYDGQGEVLTLRNEVGGRRTFQLYYGDTLTLVPASATATFSDSSLGTIKAADDAATSGNWVWIADSAFPANPNGKLNVVIGDKTYSCDVTVGPPLWGLYSTIPSGSDYSGYIVKENGASTVPFTANAAKTVYLYIDNTNFSFINDDTAKPESSNSAVSVTHRNTQTLEITLAANNTGTIETLITCPAQEGDTTHDWTYRIIFSDGTALYDDRGNVLTLRNESGGRQTFHLYYGENHAVVPVNAEVEFSDSNLGTITVAPEEDQQYGNWVWIRDSAVPGTSGKLNVTVDSKTYSCDVTVTMPVIGVYSDSAFQNYVLHSNRTFEYTTGNTPTVYIRPTDGSTISSITKNQDDNAVITVTISDDKTYAAVTVSADAVGRNRAELVVTTSNGEECYIYTTFVNTSQSGSGNNQGGVSPSHTLVSEKRNLTTSDVITEEAADVKHGGPISFMYDTDNDNIKETYYLCTMMPNSEDETIYSMAYTGASGTQYRENAIFNNSYCMGIWTYDKGSDRYTLVSGRIKEILLQAFGDTWTATTYRVSDDTFADIIEECPSYPAIYSWNDENGWPLGVTFQIDNDSIGSWRHEFSGAIDGQTVTMCANFSCFFVYESLEETATSVAEANAILQEWSDLKDSDDLGFLGSTSYTLNLTSGQFNGIIYIPYNMTVNVHGSTSRDRTVLYGGIGGSGCADNVRNIDFIGCGWWATNWPNDEVYKGEANYGLFSEKGAEYHDCSFKNFYHALHCGPTAKPVPIVIFGGHRSTFENNYIAAYLNSTMNGGGNMTMVENIFRHNGCAIWMESTGNDFPMNTFAFVRCKFYDNGWDVINLLGLCYFIPGQLFVRDDQYGHGKFTSDRNAISHNGASPRSVENYASSAVTDASEVGSGVYTFPVAVDDKFEEFDYTNSNAVIANFNAASWLIPENDLNGKTITVIQDDKGEDVTIWTFEEENQ